MSEFIEFLKIIQSLKLNREINNSILEKHKFSFRYPGKYTNVLISLLNLFALYINNQGDQNKIKDIKESFNSIIEQLYQTANNKSTNNDYEAMYAIDKFIEISSDIYRHESNHVKNELYIWVLKKLIALDMEMISQIENENPNAINTIRPKNRIVECLLNIIKHEIFNSESDQLNYALLLNSIESTKHCIQQYKFYIDLEPSITFIEGLTHLINSDFDQASKIFKNILNELHSIDDIKTTVGYKRSTEMIVLFFLDKLYSQYSNINQPLLTKYQARLKAQSFELLHNIFKLEDLKISKYQEAISETLEAKESAGSKLCESIESLIASFSKDKTNSKLLADLNIMQKLEGLKHAIPKLENFSDLIAENYDKKSKRIRPYTKKSNNNEYKKNISNYEGDIIFVLKYQDHKSRYLKLMHFARKKYIEAIVGALIDGSNQKKFNFKIDFEEEAFTLSFEIPNSRTLARFLKGVPGCQYSFNNKKHSIRYIYENKIKESDINTILTRIKNIFDKSTEYTVNSLDIDLKNLSIASQMDSKNSSTPSINPKSKILYEIHEEQVTLPKQKIKTRKFGNSQFNNNNNNNNNITRTPESIILEQLRDRFGENVTIGRIRNTSEKTHKYVILPPVNAIDLDLTNEQHQSIQRVFEQPSIVGFSNMQGFKYYRNCNNGLVAKMKGANGHIRLTPGQVIEEEKTETAPAYSAYYYNKGFRK